MTVREIVKKYLEENGFDGLYNPGECACKKDDLMPCEYFVETDNCEPVCSPECEGKAEEAQYKENPPIKTVQEF